MGFGGRTVGEFCVNRALAVANDSGQNTGLTGQECLSGKRESAPTVGTGRLHVHHVTNGVPGSRGRATGELCQNPSDRNL